MAPNRMQERAGPGQAKAVPVSDRKNARASAKTLRLIEDTHNELGYYANTVSLWLRELDLSRAEVLFMLASVMACGIEEAWPDEEQRPHQIVKLMAAIEGSGDLLASLSILARAEAGDLDEAN